MSYAFQTLFSVKYFFLFYESKGVVTIRNKQKSNLCHPLPNCRYHSYHLLFPKKCNNDKLVHLSMFHANDSTT